MKKEEKNDLTYILGEIVNPLAVVSEGLNLLKDYFDGHKDLKQKQIFNSVQSNMERICALVKGISDGIERNTHPTTATHFDVLQQIQQVCATHDQMFLQRQLHYRVIASADLPKAFANPDQIFIVISHLISNAIKFAPRATEIGIKVREVPLRQGNGIEVSVVNECPNFTEKDRYQIFERFYNNAKASESKVAGVGLAVSREIVQKSGGQLWVGIPSKGKVYFTFVLPCAETIPQAKPRGNQTYKYDITIANFKDLKENLGGEKISLLLQKIEESVRKLVRYPIDVVAAFEMNGIISTIYETNEGNASSVATRISQKLGTEEFKVGKANVPIVFKYHLSVLQ